MNKFFRLYCVCCVWLVILVLCSTLIYPIELHQLKELKELGIKKAKFIQQKFDKLFKEQPELKQYISRPSTRDLLKELRGGKGVDTVYLLGIRVEFQPDTDTLTTGCGLMDRDHNTFPYDSLGYPTVGFRPVNVQRTIWDTPFDSIVGNRGYHSLWHDPPHTKRYFEHLLEFLHNYWWDVSGHKVWIKYKVVPEPESACYQLPYKLTYYGDPNNWVRGILTLFRDAVVMCDQMSPEIDFSKYAGTSGGIVVFRAGASWQTDGGNSPYDIPDVFIAGIDRYFGTPIWVDNGTVPIVDGILYSETAFQDGAYSFLQGGLCHEMGHMLGLPDLYDTDLRTMGIGGWELMATGNWNLNGLLPSSISAWCSEKLGFIQPVEVHRADSFSIYMRCGQDTTVRIPKIYRIPINTKEYFLVEERLATVSQDTMVYKFDADSITDVWHIDSTGTRVWKDGVLTCFWGHYDWGLPPDSGKGGLAIWHIDNEKIAKDSAKNEINVGTPKGVDMEEADGIQDFEIPWWLASDRDALFHGSPHDVFYKGSLDEFTPYTSPNTNDNLNSLTHISVYNISYADTIMRFAVKFGMRYGKFPVKCGRGGVFDVNSPKVAKVNGNYVLFSTVIDTSKIIIRGDTSFVGGIVFAFDADGNILWSDTTLAVPGATNPYGTNLFSSVGIGDIDGNDTLDVVAMPFVVWGVPYKNQRLKIKSRDLDSDIFSKVEGNLCAWNVYGKPLFTKYRITEGAIFGSPLLADINNDGKDEIIFGANDGKLRVFNGNGDTLWTKDLHEWILTTPVWDSANNTLYAVAMDGKLWALSAGGDTLWTAIEPSLGLTTSSPVVGDINRDGRVEIIVVQGGKDIHCVDDSGKIIWTKNIEDTNFYSSPGLAFIDTDSLLDIIISAGNKIYVLNSNGANVVSFPVNTGSVKKIQASPVIGDIDNDGSNEIIISLPEGKLLCYNNKGEMVKEFPLSVGGEIYSTPLIVDLNQDGNVEVFVGCDDSKLYGWSIGRYGDLAWPSIHRFEDNNGIYEELPTLAPSPIDAFMTNDFYIYPNPITSKGWVRYFSGDASSVNIKIINLAGEVVEELEGKVGKNNYQDVMLPDMPSGVYLCRVEVKGSNKNLVRFKKFAVVK